MKKLSIYDEVHFQVYTVKKLNVLQNANHFSNFDETLYQRQLIIIPFI